MEDESILDFNFWPSFGDLMLSLVLILLVLIYSIATVLSIGNFNRSTIVTNQMEMVKKIADDFNGSSCPINANQFDIKIPAANKGTSDIIITNEPTHQMITFSDQILFDPDDYHLKKEGKEVLSTVGQRIMSQLDTIKEIQILGHADNKTSNQFESNLHLGALRAIEVFRFMKDEVKIDPAQHLMSASTFGEFKPAEREDNDYKYNFEKLNQDNQTSNQRDKNRRIELCLLYRY
jgi:flagellar motor protein MotB